jgi:hypothetical protein
MERVNLKRQNITKANYAIIQLLSFVLPFMETITDLEVVGKGFIQKDNIKKLTVIGIAPSLDVLIRIFDRCSQLTHLSFKNSNVSDTIVNSLLSRVVVTESLSFDRCFRITELPFSNSTSNCYTEAKRCWRLEESLDLLKHEDLIEMFLFGAYCSPDFPENYTLYFRLHTYCVNEMVLTSILQTIRFHNLTWDRIDSIQNETSTAPTVTFDGYPHDVCFFFSSMYMPLPQLVGIGIMDIRVFIH